MSVPIILGFILAFIHYFSEFFHNHCNKKLVGRLLSFVAGVSVSYLFLYLLPELTQGTKNLNMLLFFFLLTGFTFFHLIEKYVYQHETGNKRAKQLNEIHTITFFCYHVLVGVVLTRLAVLGMRNILLFFVPIALHSAISSFSLKEVHSSKHHESHIARIFLSLSPLFGVFFALRFGLADTYFYSSLGFLGGALLYIVIHDLIPRGKKGKPFFFFLGTFLYAVTVYLTFTL